MSSDFDAVRRVIHTYPVIDNHAHNLLRDEHADVYPFESVTSEASGQALKGVHSQLSHVRAVCQLQQLYGSKAGDWDSVLEARKTVRKHNAQKLLRTIFAKTHCILVDDGLDQTHVHPYYWHSRLTPAPAKRIVRIESIAEAIVNARPLLYEEDVHDIAAARQVFAAFQGSFKYRIKQAIEDPDVVAFKSIICYRSHTSLDVVARPPDLDVVAQAFTTYISSLGKRENGKRARFTAKSINECLLHDTLALIRDFRPGKVHRKPIQLHTGLGDSDIRLLQSNPAYLQPLIEAYPMVPFVLLHSAYPYTREAGYLATVYSNVFLDLGEVFPMVSRAGQLSILRHSLELTPVHKLLYSSDGHYFPETYYLAELQFREALEVVVGELMQHQELDGDQAKNLVQSILFQNSNQLYRLGLTLAEGLTAAAPRTSLDGNQNTSSVSVGAAAPAISLGESKLTSMNLYNVLYVHVQWCDYLGQVRSRMLPTSAFEHLIGEDRKIGISAGNIGTLQNDTSTVISSPIGQIFVKPDVSTLRSSVPISDPISGLKITSTTCMSIFTDTNSRPLPSCPRSTLSNVVASIQEEYGLSILLGFEIEVVFLRLRPHDASPSENAASTVPYTNTHSWSTFHPDQHAALPLLHAITAQLATMQLPIQQCHAEAAAGQFEFVLPPLPAVKAVDALIQARQAIQQVAHQYGARATFHPQPMPGFGTASHAHVSLGKCKVDTEWDFWGGVSSHLSSSCAFLLSNEASFQRVKQDSWTNGEWIAWGTQNREVPLRRIPGQGNEGCRWEVRCLDGLANMYLAMAAVLATGLIGLRESKGMQGTKDCQANPSQLSDDQRKALGITNKLPTLAESLSSLQEDTSLIQILGSELVNNYLVIKRAEMQMLRDMGPEKSHRFLVDRY